MLFSAALVLDANFRQVHDFLSGAAHFLICHTHKTAYFLICHTVINYGSTIVRTLRFELW
jgi:hypothetical protein